jgi:hypothetical protein
MATRETAAADSNVSKRKRCDRAMAMALRGRDGETWVVSKQIQRERKRAMETRAPVIKAGQRRHKWAMVQATATVMYHKGLSFYNLIINKDGPRMLARQRDNNEQQFKLPPSSNTVSLRRISFFSEIRSPRSITPFFSKTPHFPLNQIKLPLRRSPSQLVLILMWLRQLEEYYFSFKDNRDLRSDWNKYRKYFGTPSMLKAAPLANIHMVQASEHRIPVTHV